MKILEKGKIDLNIGKLDLYLAGIKDSLRINGKISTKGDFPVVDLKIRNSLDLQNRYSFIDKLDNIDGEIEFAAALQTSAEGILESRKKVKINHFSADFYLDSLKKDVVQIRNLDGEVPINLMVDVNKIMLKSKKNYLIDSENHYSYMYDRDDYLRKGYPVSNLNIEKIAIRHSKLDSDIDNVNFDIYFDDNKFAVNNIYCDLLGGNATGRLIVDFKEGILDSTLLSRSDLQFAMTASGINTTLLSGLAQDSTKITSSTSQFDNLNLAANFNMNGLNLKENPVMTGGLNITRISDADAKRLLDFINKGSDDVSIAMLKNILNVWPGIKVKLFSFNIKNNFLYTLIKLEKPWIMFWFPLAEEIRLSKQSLKFYIDKYLGDKLE